MLTPPLVTIASFVAAASRSTASSSASSSRTTGRRSTTQPAAASSGASIVELLSRICPGRSGAPSVTSSSPVDSTATRADGNGGDAAGVDAGEHAGHRGCDDRAGAQHDLPRPHVIARPAHGGAGGHDRTEADAAALEALAVLDHRHGVGAGGHRRTGHDPHGLPWTHDDRRTAPRRPPARRRRGARPARRRGRRIAPRSRRRPSWRTAGRPRGRRRRWRGRVRRRRRGPSRPAPSARTQRGPCAGRPRRRSRRHGIPAHWEGCRVACVLGRRPRRALDDVGRRRTASTSRCAGRTRAGRRAAPSSGSGCSTCCGSGRRGRSGSSCCSATSTSPISGWPPTATTAGAR